METEQLVTMYTWDKNRNYAFKPNVTGDQYVLIDVKIDCGEDSEDCITLFNYRNTHFYKEADGYSWEFDGETITHTFADEVQHEATNFQIGPEASYKDTARASAAGVRVKDSLGNKAEGVNLGAYVPQQQAQQAPVKQHAAETAPTQGQQTVSAASVKLQTAETAAVQSGENPKASAAAVQTAPVQTGTGIVQTVDNTAKAVAEAAATLQAKLLALFQEVQGLEDVVKLIQAAVKTLSDQDVLEALKGSSEGMSKLVQALTQVYQSVFGGLYKQSVLGQVISLLNQSVKLEPVKLAFLGGDAVPADAKLAVQKEQEFKNAQRISRDENGNVVEVVDASGNKHQFSYDESGVTETITDTQGKLSVKHLDKNGVLLSENSEGRSVTYSYGVDAQGGKQTKALERTNEGLSTLLYNAQGQLVSIESNHKKKTLEYAGEGQEQTVKATTTDDQGQVLEQKFFKGGRLVEVRNQDGSSTKYDYMSDGTGKVLAVTLEVSDKDGGKPS